MILSRILIKLYERLVFKHSKIILLLIGLLIVFFSMHLTKFRLDASSDSLILENDNSLKYYREILSRYGAEDFLIITYAPKEELFSQLVLDDLQTLTDQLANLENISSLTSILDVPLTQSPPVTLSQLSESIQTLSSEQTDRELAKKEFLSSILYKNLLISEDASTTAVIVKLHVNEKLNELADRREVLWQLRAEKGLTETQKQLLANIDNDYQINHQNTQKAQDKTISSIRTIMMQHKDNAQLYLGGVPMIVSDSIDYIGNDIAVFGVSVLAFIIVILWIAFTSVKWVILPLVTCFATGTLMVGVLGYLNWPVTVVSANFLSLLLIITLSLTIHLIVRHRELHANNPDANQYDLVLQTVQSKFVPCFYTSITTMVAFGSLIVSGIRPVINFGWMMCLGIVLAFVLTFTLFPALVLLFAPGKAKNRRDIVYKITGFFSNLVQNHGKSVSFVFSTVLIFSLIGLSQLSVENRFIDYFKSSTEIHQGMKLIDNKLGGTTPLDLIIDAPEEFIAAQVAQENQQVDEFEDEFDEDEFEDEFDDDFSQSNAGAGITGTSYWFNIFNLEKIDNIHHALDSLSQTGKVLSLSTAMTLFNNLKDQPEFDNFFLSVLYKNLPEEIKTTLIDPYMSEDGNQLRFSIRVFESDPNLDRDQLLQDIRDKLTSEFDIAPEQINLTGMLVMYNNMLHSLFKSQILTLGVVFAAIFLMFIVLFRNLKLAAITLAPNIFAAFFVLGIMGVMSIPLDLMTITIAAISVGIAVDNAIHYVHRFSEEFKIDYIYEKAIKRSHGSIGRALYYTTVTITLGFLILVLSNFVPTVYFGMLTGVAMMTALVANLTLLPLLISKFKPLG